MVRPGDTVVLKPPSHFERTRKLPTGSVRNVKRMLYTVVSIVPLSSSTSWVTLLADEKIVTMSMHMDDWEVML